MNCRGCGNQEAWHTFGTSTFETCNACGLQGGGESIPDVYLHRAGQRFDNLTDQMGRPIEILSKRHKQQVMNKLGVSEAGDKVNGATYGSKNWIDGSRAWRSRQFEKDRPVIQKTLRAWKEKQRA